MGEILQSLVVNLIVAVFGGIITLAFTHGKRRFAERRLQKKYPLQGSYLSSFEDESDCKTCVIKAPVVLKQHGLSIQGTTIHEGRQWNLDGEITKDGYLHGRYFADDVHDKGFGNFFLKVRPGPEMEGIWSGFDSANQKIAAGKYEFWPLKECEIAPMQATDIPACAAIARKQLGQSFLTADDLRKMDHIKLCAKQENTVLGFCTAKVIKSSEFLNELPNAAREVARLKVANQVGLIASVATDPKFVGFGIGTRLVEEAISVLRGEHADVLAMTAWVTKNGANIGSIAERLGFENVAEFPEYWSKSSVENDYSCPECGEPPCQCSALLYVCC